MHHGIDKPAPRVVCDDWPMTILAAPTEVGERLYANDYCGQAAASSVASDWLGRAVLPTEIQQNIPLALRIQGGTTGRALVAALVALGVPAKGPYQGSMQDYLVYLNSGRQTIGLHQCNLAAQPVTAGSTDIAHWRRFYGQGLNLINNMNPWTGKNEATFQPALYDSDLRVFVLIDGVMPKDRAAFGDDMIWDQNLKDGIIDVFRSGTFGKWPESLAAVETYASQIHDDGSNVLKVIDGLKNDFVNAGGVLLGDRVTQLEARPVTAAGATVDQIVKAIGVKLSS